MASTMTTDRRERTRETHGVLVTYRRPAELAEHLDRLKAQTAPLTSLIVVDNDDDPAIQQLLEEVDLADTAVSYLGLRDNPGPAGAIASGIETVLANHGDDHWLVLLDDDDPPPRHDTLEAVGAVANQLVDAHHPVGGVGLWGATLGRSGRLRAASGRAPEQVSYLPGGACPHYHIGALREAGGPDPRLFFGFDDLDLGLALSRVDAAVWSSGLARSHGWTSMVEDRRASRSVSLPTWRRYYSLRNLVIVLRRNGHSGAAATMSLIAGVIKPLANLPFAPAIAVANLRVNLRALVDGWSGNTGKRVDPSDVPRWLLARDTANR